MPLVPSPEDASDIVLRTDPTCAQRQCPLPVAGAAEAAELADGAAAVGAVYRSGQSVMQLLPPERQRFFASHTMTQLAIWSHTATALGNLSAATRAVASKDYRGAAAQANAAVGEMEALLAAERAGEGGVWAAWHLYHFHCFLDLPATVPPR